MRLLRLATLAVAMMTTSCSPGTSPSPSASGASFEVEVVPLESPPEVRAAIPGQHTSFLVRFSSEGDNSPATVTATASQATVDRIVPAELRPGEVGEVWLIVDPNITTDTTASVTISIERGGVTSRTDRSIVVMPMSGEGRAEEAQPYLAFWLDWLATEHPELGITAATTWEALYVSPLLIVSKMAYFSDDWEMTLLWHVMVAPSDFSEIHLRRRGDDMRPSLAFKVDSFADRTPPYAIDPPDVVIR
jgi:hypothetical protein